MLVPARDRKLIPSRDEGSSGVTQRNVKSNFDFSALRSHQISSGSGYGKTTLLQPGGAFPLLSRSPGAPQALEVGAVFQRRVGLWKQQPWPPGPDTVGHSFVLGLQVSQRQHVRVSLSLCEQETRGM